MPGKLRTVLHQISSGKRSSSDKMGLETTHAAASEREYDVVVLGATGHTGQLAAMYLDKHAESPRFAIAGRKQAALLELKQRGKMQDSVGVLVVDTGHLKGLESVAARTKVLINAVGPYRALGGAKVVEACIRAGTHYVDSSGETDFYGEIVARFHEQAEQARVKVVLSAAFACLPMDLAATLSARKVSQLASSAPTSRRRRTQKEEQNIVVDCGFSLPEGGASAGSLLSTVAVARHAPEVLKQQGSRWLTPDSAYTGARATAIGDEKVDRLAYPGVRRLAYMDKWGAQTPFSAHNVRVITRTAALSGLPFVYRETVALPYDWLAYLMAWISAGFIWLLAHSSLVRFMIEKIASALPKHAAASLEEHMKGSVNFSALATVVDLKDAQGKPLQAVCRIKAAHQDSYLLSAVTMAETALTIIAAPKTKRAGGVLTPSLVGVDTYVERLTKHANFRFQVEPFSEQDV
ncbi:hypothetical protein EX895_005143 [Sporisorium graminicola]|uniref:Saccharopine dehydrogenase NADP binding domain-containing protein n=1 Tax=Sporisorium graminicola TaxID=280036 RepID=A0A4U7KSS6_9BASI|nr:hypothetical protein EX895_005143 [Sporisorium graminicola]TKY86318.1 hypothetical protein EX895_005143 [Sporisorium graminicola]